MIDARWVVLVSLGLVLGAGHARAELYRCTDSAGKVSYTGDPHACRGVAERHETRRQLQRTGPAAVAPLSLRDRSRRTAAPRRPQTGGSEAMWRRKRGEAEAELRRIEADLPRWARLQANCSRGADTWYTDEAGIKHTIRCSDIAASRRRVEAEGARLREYLNGGLEDECRRAGCLPGWIR